MKKAQGGLNAAILVAVIAGLIILYILFLPAQEREALLENKTVKKSSSDDKEDENTLLSVFPNRLEESSEVEDKDIPNIFLFETTNAKELERINPFIVRKGWFDEKTKTAAFTMNNLETTDNVILSFKAKKHEGILTIKLNGEVVFENNIEQETVAPIKLKKDLLKEDNSLDFTVSSVGLKFWKTNEYSLEDIKIIGDITDRSKQESRNIFTLTSKDLANIEEANLRFVPYCKSVADVGTLDITINERNLFSAVPICDDAYKQPIPIGLLDAGENKIIFKTSRGSYSVEQIKIEFEEKEVEKKVYFFEANQSQIDDIESGDKDAILRLEFVDDKENKMADININDHFITLDDDERIFTKNVNEFIKEGNNFIEIRPRTRLDIVELSIKLEER
ncbi:hypothetical protein HYU50_01255 [Candidatus Woesearchaeota archaeon]|nr:hypothetical protein [Candidatus Woesearchaeota archaeon]